MLVVFLTWGRSSLPTDLLNRHLNGAPVIFLGDLYILVSLCSFSRFTNFLHRIFKASAWIRQCTGSSNLRTEQFSKYSMFKRIGFHLLSFQHNPKPRTLICWYPEVQRLPVSISQKNKNFCFLPRWEEDYGVCMFFI